VRRTEIEVLGEMAAALRAETRRTDGLLNLLRLLSELVNFDRAGVFVFDSQRKRLEPIASIGGTVDLIEGVEFELGCGFSSWVAKRRKATLLTDLQRPARDEESPLRCFMSVPIIVHGDLIGVLNLGHSQPRAFDEDHLRLVSTASSLIAATLTREVAERILAENAAIDTRTGVLTAKQFAARVLEETDRSRRYGDPLALALVRVEDYPAYVDAQGLGTAEAALRDLARLLRSSVRSIDPVGQVEPGEFAVLLVHTTMAEARAAVARLGESVAKHNFPRRKRLKIACAVAAFPEGGEEFSELLVTARRRFAPPASASPRMAAGSPGIATGSPGMAAAPPGIAAARPGIAGPSPRTTAAHPAPPGENGNRTAAAKALPPSPPLRSVPSLPPPPPQPPPD
jgi:diguanylate cyclase (GGDEF)-like protein